MFATNGQRATRQNSGATIYAKNNSLQSKWTAGLKEMYLAGFEQQEMCQCASLLSGNDCTLALKQLQTILVQLHV